MTIALAHSRAKIRSSKTVQTIYVVQEEQNDGTLYDVCTSNDLDTFYAGISDNHIIAAYEAGSIAR